MNLIKQTRIQFIIFYLGIPLVLMLFLAVTEGSQASQKTSDELLLEIVDLHSELVTNETFLAQAKMLGAYLEAAQPLEEAKKIKIYVKVFDILSKIKNSTVQIPSSAAESENVAEQKPLDEEKQEAKTVYVPGAALLEIFKFTGSETSLEQVPELPIIRTYWKLDLACSSHFLLPERLAEVGEGSAYAGKFSFYYKAKRSGKYSFTIQHDKHNGCVLKIGGIKILEASPKEPVCQGMCNLEKGFQRIEFWLFAGVPEKDFFGDRYSAAAAFQVKILTPDAFDSVPLTKDMMLLKAEQNKEARVEQGEKAKREPIPYIDY